LQLKEGAQVMFIKNDYSGEQRYFNGKIGTVSEISEEGIEVSFTDGSEPTLVEEYTWENKKFSLNKETGEIEETIKGTFKHLPIKLAWAITIHKSQGLTFQKAIIDVSKAFAPGQIYVALSRLVSLDGLVLNRPLPENIMEPDEALKLFSQNKKDPKALEKEYKQELPRYITDVILRSFDFSSMLNEIQAHIETYQKDEKRSIKQKHKSWAIELKKDVAELKEIGDRFQKQIHSITQQSDDDWLYNLQGRVQSAKSYFKTQLESLSEKVLQHIDDLQGQAGVKKYIEELKELENLFFRQNKHIHKANALIDAAIKNKEISKETLDDKTLLKERQKQLNSKAASTKKKKPKKKTKEITLELYKKGNTIEEIAQERSLAESTIEGHLAHFVGKGELHLTEFLDETKAGQIQQVADTLKTTKLNEIKSRLGDEFTYTDLKFAMAGYEVKGD
jgi:DNA-binding CsgD family transcriptional regulator